MKEMWTTRLFDRFTSRRNAKRLIVGGVIGYVAAIALFFATLLPLYGRVSECLAVTAVCSDNAHTAQLELMLVQVLVSVASIAIIIGLLMMVVVRVQEKQSAKNHARQSMTRVPLSRQGIKVFVCLIAFFVGGSIASIVIADIVSALFSTKDTAQQGRILAYLTIIIYPLTGALAAYLASKWLDKKLR